MGIPPAAAARRPRDARAPFPRLAAALTLVGLLAAGAGAARAESVLIELPPNPSPRIAYGVDRLVKALDGVGDTCRTLGNLDDSIAANRVIVIGRFGDPRMMAVLGAKATRPGAEGFVLRERQSRLLAVAGADDSGVLYGCLELVRRVKEEHALPAALDDREAPALRFRGPCVGLQKMTILPGYTEYLYPYTPKLFPWFYDKSFWLGYLDFLAENRMNVLFLWSGHPFASLVKIKDYPYALEVSEKTYERNVDIYRFLIREADRRGIRLVQGFYNIELSKPFAERNGLATELRAPNPLAADYTRKSIAEFVRRYPSVWLMMTLGEALRGYDNQLRWFTEVIVPGVKDGMREAGLTEAPPLILRVHTIEDRTPDFLRAALKVYRNIDTMDKYNGESLTTSQPRGDKQRLHLAVSRLAVTHIANVHILANLEPFRYGDQRFIQRCVQAMRDRLGARGLHLYPLSYWNWPYAPDKTAEPLLQYQRDWIWYEAWARYAWNPDIPEAEDHAYWVGRLAAVYGAAAADKILAAYNDSGQCAPLILRRFGLTEGNRQTLSLGMTLDQLVNPDKYHAYPGLWLSQAPPGERLQEYVDREWRHEPHSGETPPQVIREVLDFSDRAVREIDEAGPLVTDNPEEFGRLQNDIHCIREMSLFYAAKAQAAMLVLRYAHSHDPADMRNAAILLGESLRHFRALAQLTADTYWYANSLQTGQRRIPFKGFEHGKPAYFHWTQLLPVYEKEYRDFQARADALK